MKGVLVQIFCFLISVSHCRLMDRIVDSSFRENNPRELNPIIEHCGEERGYKQLAIISMKEDLSFEFYRNIHEGFLVPVQVLDHLNGLDLVGWRSCVILYLPSRWMMKFSETVDKYSWIPSNLYVIYTNDEPAIDGKKNVSYERAWTSSGAELWKKDNVHKLILSINGRNLFFDPFEPSANSENRKKLIFNETRQSENSFGALRDLGISVQLLRPRDTFEGYEANVALFPYVTVQKVNDETWSGVDADAMKEILKRMKIVPRFFDPPEKFGWFLRGKFYGTLGRLVYHRSDFAFNGFFIKDYGTRMLEFSSYLHSDKICVIVSKSARLPEYLLIVRIFSFHSWLLIFVGNSFAALTSVGMTGNFGLLRINDFKKSFENSWPKLEECRKLTIVHRFLGEWIFLCFYPVKIKAKWLGQRLHIAFGLMLGIVIGGCFTSQLASSFSRPAFLKNIETLAELDESGMKVLTSFPNLLHDVFADNESSTFRNLQMKLKLSNTSEIERQVLRKRDAGYIDRVQSLILDKNASNELHIVSEYPQEYYLAYPIAKGSPFLPRMNEIIGRFQNGGLYGKWFDDMRAPLKNHHSHKPVVIQLPHLFIPFFILFLGLGIAGGIFCCELIKGSKTNMTKNKKFVVI